MALPVVLGDGLAGGQPDLQGPEGALFVVGVDLGGGLRIRLLQMDAQGGQAFRPDPGLELFPQAVVRLEGGELTACHQIIDVESGSPRHNGQSAPGQDIVHDGDGALDVPGHGIIFFRIGHVQHMMGNALHLFLGGLGGADVHAAVNLHGVGGHHLSPEAPGQSHGQGGFARGGGAADN